MALARQDENLLLSLERSRRRAELSMIQLAEIGQLLTETAARVNSSRAHVQSSRALLALFEARGSGALINPAACALQSAAPVFVAPQHQSKALSPQSSAHRSKQDRYAG